MLKFVNGIRGKKGRRGITGKSRGESQEIHCRNRARLRYGINLSPKRYASLISSIQNNNDCVLLKKQTDTKSIYAVKLDDVWLPVIYDSQQCMILTILSDSVINDFANLLY